METKREIEDGVTFYVVILYPSGIHRVQKLLSGINGKFGQSHDGSWWLKGNKWYPAFFSKQKAEDVAVQKNWESYNKLRYEAQRALNRFLDIDGYTKGLKKRESHAIPTV